MRMGSGKRKDRWEDLRPNWTGIEEEREKRKKVLRFHSAN